MDAVLFNPAYTAFEEYNLKTNDYTGSMVSYIVEGEILSQSIGKLYELHGEKKILESNMDFTENINTILNDFKNDPNAISFFKALYSALKETIDEIEESVNAHKLSSVASYIE